MSLDVYLRVNYLDNEVATYNNMELCYLQANYAISQMHGSTQPFLDYMSSLPHGWRKIANRDNIDWIEQNEEVYWANITHNLGKMAGAAGIYQHLWRPEEIGITKASELIEPLTAGLALLKRNEKLFMKFNSPNGWGMYEHFVPFVEKYLKACIEFPDAMVSVSR